MSRHLLIGTLWMLLASLPATDLPFTVAWTPVPDLSFCPDGTVGRPQDGLQTITIAPWQDALLAPVRLPLACQ